MSSNFSNGPNSPSGNPFESAKPVDEIRGFGGEPQRDTTYGSPVVTGFCWFLILGLTISMFLMTAYVQLQGPDQQGDASSAELMNINLQAKFLSGQSEIEKFVTNSQGLKKKQEANQNKEKIRKEVINKNKSNVPVPNFDFGPPEQRWVYAIILNEHLGTDEALSQLESTDDLIQNEGYETTERQKRIRGIVHDLIQQYDAGDYDSDSLPMADQEFLTKEMGWTGQLLLYPSQSPHKSKRTEILNDAFFSTMMMVVMMFVGLLMGVAGLGALAIFFYKFVNRQLVPRFLVSNRGGVYIETFTIWMLMFVGMQFGLSYAVEFKLVPGNIMKFLTPVVFFGSLIVLAWPVFRGISFEQVRADIGLKIANPFKEGFYGGTSYLAMLPVLFCAMIMVVVLIFLISTMQPASGELASQGGASHPIQDQIASGNTLDWILIVITACIAAPVVEETMFRGVLYRHLRDLTGKWNRFGSVIVASLVNGVVFAAIHPQGIFGIPILTSLAIGFSLVREWRGSLVGPMVMHAINNFMVTCLMFVIM